MPVTRHPPHRSRRAALPHRAPALGHDAQAQREPAGRSRAPVTGRTRLCVRPLVCWTTFPLASPLLSTPSASPSALRPLFGSFTDTMGLSDSLHPCIMVVPLGFTMRTWQECTRPEAGPPGFRTQCFRACQRSPTPPGPSTPRPHGVSGVAFRVFGARRHPGGARFRGSILCLHLPLSTLRRHRYRRLRMTRGQCGWLDLHCQGLAPFTTVPACPGAYPNATRQALEIAGAKNERRLFPVAVG
jgi:hypothetical protein